MARDIYNEERNRKPSVQTVIFDHLALYNNLFEIHRNIPGPATKLAADVIHQLSLIDLVSKIPVDDIITYYCVSSYLYDRISSIDIQDKIINENGFYSDKVHRLMFQLNQRIVVQGYIENLPSDENQENLVDDTQIEIDNNNISSMFKQALSSQYCGVKNGFIRSRNNNSIFVFLDPQILREKVRSTLSSDKEYEMQEMVTPLINQDAIAIVMETNKTQDKNDIKNFFSKLNNFDFSNPESKLEDYLDTKIDFVIKKGGDITSSFSSGSLERIARDEGKYSSFRQVQAEILADLIDLVTPIEYSEKAFEIEDEEDKRLASKRERVNDVDDIFGRLLLPRIKAARQLSTKKYSKDSEQHREIRLHNVVWHIRKLPNGWHTSPEAIMMAKEAGIALNEGETFVRPHKRGSKKLGEVVANLLVKRN